MSALPSSYILIYIIIVELLNLLQFLLSSWPDHSWKIHFYKSVKVFGLINKRYIKLPLPKAGCSFYLMTWLFFSGLNWHHPREMSSTESRPTTPLQHFKSRKSVLNRQTLFFPLYVLELLRNGFLDLQRFSLCSASAEGIRCRMGRET